MQPGPRPVRPSTAAAVTPVEREMKKLLRSSKHRLGIDVSEACHNDVKAKAATKGLSIRDYLLGLLAADGCHTGD